MSKFLQGKLKYLTLFIAGGLADLSLAPFYIFPVLFISFPVFYKILSGATNKKQAFLIGWMFGFGFFVFGLYWIANSLLVDAEKFAWLIPFAVCGIPFGLAIYVGLFGAAYQILRRDNNWQNILLFASLWVIFEYLRGILFTGFPWNLIGYAALFSNWFAQSAALGGVYLLSFFIVVIALLPSYYKAKIFTVIVIILTVLNFAYGYVHVNQSIAPAKKLKLLLFQPNIAESMKWEPEVSKEQFVENVKYLKTLDFKNKDIVLLPETGVPFDLSRQPLVVQALKEVTPANGLLVTGALRSEGKTLADYKVWNTLYTISQQGVYSFYDKVHLVPFGEFVPLRKYLPFINKITPGNVDISSGEKTELIKYNGFSFLSLICYEIIFPEYAASKPQPDFIVNVTNDGWFGNSTGPYQHLAMAQMRAIEQGEPVIRDANSGISAVIDGHGKLLQTLPLSVRGVIDYELELRKTVTIYALYGDKIIFGLIIIIMIALFLYRKKN